MTMSTKAREAARISARVSSGMDAVWGDIWNTYSMFGSAQHPWDIVRMLAWCTLMIKLVVESRTLDGRDALDAWVRTQVYGDDDTT